MDNSSYFIQGKAMFGSFPTQDSVHELERKGVRYFVDLTFPSEKKIVPYTTTYVCIRFPIPDCRAPRDWNAFACFIIRIADIIDRLPKGEKLYLHCKGGHGRAGVVVASLLCHIYGLDPQEGIHQTSISHSKRSVMREKWRKIGSPQTYPQKRFIHKFFSSLVFYRAFKHGHTGGFSTFTPHQVKIKGFGVFPTAEAAIQAYKSPNDDEYVQSQQDSLSPVLSREMGRSIRVRPDWSDIREAVVYAVTKLKFDQHPYLKVNLLNTGLRRIMHHDDANRDNVVGRALVKLREYYYRDEEL